MKPKIKWIENTEDSIWLNLSSGDETIKLLCNIFDIDDEAVGNRESYEDLINYHQYIDEKDCIAYTLYLKDNIYIILRKIRDWEKKRDKLMKYFEFSKPE